MGPDQLRAHGHFWTHFNNFGHIWTHFGQILQEISWGNGVLDTFGHIWTHLDTFGQMCS